MHFARFVLSVTLWISSTCAQTHGHWEEITFPSAPFARQHHAMTYDAARGETVVFGGYNGAYLNDTWTLDSQGWTLRATTTAPSARAEASIAYDPVRERVVLIGGYDQIDISGL